MNDLLIARSKSQSQKVRARAAYRLANSRDERALQVLIRGLSDESPKVRRQAAFALSTICSMSALQPLINALQDPDLETCRRAALALGKIGHPDAIGPLIQLFYRDNIELHYSAQKALMRIGRLAIPALKALYDSPDTHIRALAVQTLGRIGDTQAIDVFVRALSDSDKWIRWMTASIACSIYDERFIDPLISCLDDEFMRWNAARALGHVGNKQTIGVLTAIANKPNSDSVLRSKATYAVEQIRQRLNKVQ